MNGTRAFFLLLLLTVLLPQLSLAHEVDDSKEHVIHITATGFEPRNLEINVGETVTFENTDTEEHWPASNIHPTHTVYPGTDISKCGTDAGHDMFDACRGLKTDEEFSFTFEKVGEWKFHDHLVPKFSGRITVKGDGSEIEKEDTTALSVKIVRWFRVTFKKIEYALFPGKLDRMLANTNIFDVVKDDRTSNREGLRELIAIVGPEKVTTDLLAESEGGGSLIDCHQEAHQVGRVAYEVLGARVFGEGSALCHSGFYHGAMEAFLSEHGTANIADDIENVCSQFKTNFSLFECLHGTGHGVMAYENYDMPEALKLCGKLKTQWDQQSCYGGVFMENIVAAQGLGAIPGHDTEWVNKDLQYPCNALSKGYATQYECYQMQTSWMLTLTNWNFDKVIGACYQAPRNMIPVCFRSLGRDIAGHTMRNPDDIVALCKMVPSGENRLSCIIGALNVIVDHWGPTLKDQGDTFCATTTADTRKECYATLEGRKHEIFDTRS